jgi:hypothetical protein
VGLPQALSSRSFSAPGVFSRLSSLMPRAGAWAAVDPACRRGALPKVLVGSAGGAWTRSARAGPDWSGLLPPPYRIGWAPGPLRRLPRHPARGSRTGRFAQHSRTRRWGSRKPFRPMVLASGRLVGLAGVGGGARAPSSPSARRPLRGNLGGPYPRRPAGPGTRHPRRGSADDDGVADGALSTGIRRVGDQRAVDHHGRRATPVEVDRLDHAERPRHGGGLGDG